MSKLTQFFLLCLLSVLSSSGLSNAADCSAVLCPKIQECPEGTTEALQDSDSIDASEDDCCKAPKCVPINCNEEACLELSCNSDEYKGILPGDCCQSCISKLINDLHPLCGFGDEFIDPTNPCLSCSCFHGEVSCSDTSGECSEFSNNCTKLVTIEGQCCPICEDENEQSTSSTDESCNQENCPELSCNSYEYEGILPGDCCQSCISKLINDPHPLCDFGDEFIDPTNPCSSCSCFQGEVSCSDTSEECSELPNNCTKLVTIEGQCCPICEDENEQSTSSTDESCNQENCPELSCNSDEYEGILPGDCCQSCITKLIIDPNPLCDYGDEFIEPTNPCMSCSCVQGDISCLDTSEECSELPDNCTQVVTIEGQCCPICEDENEQSTSSTDESCNQENCPELSCNSDEYKGILPGDCCQSCISIDPYPLCDYGDKFIDPTNPCMNCSCFHGNVSCLDTSLTCLELSCNSDEYKGILPGDCCQSCISKLIIDPYPLCDYGDEFMEPTNPCMSCSCVQGNISCLDTSEECSELTDNCIQVVKIEGQCCPICEDENEQSTSSTDESCNQENCPELSCNSDEYKGILPGDCCQSCVSKLIIDPIPLCDYGDEFIDPTNPCMNCSCFHGKVSCLDTSLTCPELSCNSDEYKGILPGDCCQSCISKLIIDPYPLCDYGDEFMEPTNPCMSCSCVQGNISCLDTSEECSELPDNCIQVVKIEGQCCPICEDENEQSTSSTDESCNQENCPELSCNSDEYKGILPGDCCQSCVSKLIIDPIPLCDYGDEFIDPTNPCMNCSCFHGKVSCLDTSLTCPELSCNSEQYEGILTEDCCQSCISKLIIDPYPLCDYGDEFIDPTNPCMSCSCFHGDISCLDTSEECSELPDNCTQVVTIEGQCCPICEDENEQSTSSTDEICNQENCSELSCNSDEYKGILIGDCCISKLIIDPYPLCDYGDEFIDPTNPCSSCSCFHGEVSCSDTSGECSELPNSCTKLVTIEGQCCPICEDENEQSTSSTDESCNQENCPELSCNSDEYEGILPGDCCQSCVSKLIIDPYPLCDYGDEFIDPMNPCMNCSCFHGKVSCLDISLTCLELSCNSEQYEGILIGDCCKSCISKFIIDPYPPCDYGDEFTEPTNPCKSCSCVQGDISCLSEECSELPDCTQVVTIEGQCCPICEDENEQSTSSTDENCNQENCPELSCNSDEYKGILPGDCCQSCISKLINDPYPLCDYGDEFIDPTNPCSSCSCFHGGISCSDTSEECSELPDNCTQVVMIEGQCCPICEDVNLSQPHPSPMCHKEGSFMDPDDPCLSCSCHNGNTSCSNITRTCNQLPSSCKQVTHHRKECCPTCLDDNSITDNVDAVFVEKHKTANLDQITKVLGEMLGSNDSLDTRFETTTSTQDYLSEHDQSSTFFLVCVGTGSLIILVVAAIATATIVKCYMNSRIRKKEATKKTITV